MENLPLYHVSLISFLFMSASFMFCLAVPSVHPQYSRSYVVSDELNYF